MVLNRAGLPNNFGRGVARAVYRLVSQSLLLLLLHGRPASAGFFWVFLGAVLGFFSGVYLFTVFPFSFCNTRRAVIPIILLLPTETYVGDPEQCSRMDDSPDDPGISNAWDSSDSCGASGGGPSRGA